MFLKTLRLYEKYKHYPNSCYSGSLPFHLVPGIIQTERPNQRSDQT